MVRRIKVVSYGLLCFLAGAALVLLAGAGGTQEAPVGRYQVSATSGGAYILDTQTGHLWGKPSIGAVSYDLGTQEHPICEIVKP
jgi:hypothetical protein